MGRKPLPHSGRPAARPARSGQEHDEPRQAVDFAANAVGDPGPHRRASEPRRSRVGEELGRAVIEDVGLHAADDGHVVDHRAEWGNSVDISAPHFPQQRKCRREPRSFASCLMKAKRWFFTKEGGMTCSIQLVELRLVVEQLQLARTARHKQEDHAAWPWRQNAEARGPADWSGDRPWEKRAVFLRSTATPRPPTPSPTPQSAKKCRRVSSRSSRIELEIHGNHSGVITLAGGSQRACSLGPASASSDRRRSA